MPKTFTAPRARLGAALTGKGREVGAEQAHERNVIAITRRLVAIDRRLRAIAREQKALRAERRLKKRELRLVLQRNPDATLEQLALAGQADGADRAVAIAEHTALRATKEPVALVIPALTVTPDAQAIAASLGDALDGTPVQVQWKDEDLVDGESVGPLVVIRNGASIPCGWKTRREAERLAEYHSVKLEVF
jgi:hypothetical protein